MSVVRYILCKYFLPPWAFLFIILKHLSKTRNGYSLRLFKTPFQPTSKAWWCVCDLSYVGGIGRKIVVKAGLRQKCKTLSER
jgi:hypothetical protein